MTPVADAPGTDQMQYLNWESLHISLMWVHDGPLAEEHRNRSFEGALGAAWLLRKGTLKFTFKADEYHVRACQWVFPPSSSGWVEFSDDAELLSIRFIVCWPDGTALFAPPACLIVDADEYPELETAGRELAHLARTTLGDRHTRMRDGHSTLEDHLNLRQYFYRWLIQYSRVMRKLGVVPRISGGSDDRLPRALQFMEEYAQSNIREADIARHVSLSVSQLNRLFSRRFGMSPKALMDSRRMQRAKHELEYSQAPIKTIAYSLGFASLPHFSRWFSRRAGCSPSQYRMSLKSARDKSSQVGRPRK